MLKRLFVLLFVRSVALGAHAQELQCDVVVNSEQVAFADRQLFTEMQSRIFEFMNNRRWTNQSYRVEERIKCRTVCGIERIERRNQARCRARAMVADTEQVSAGIHRAYRTSRIAP